MGLWSEKYLSKFSYIKHACSWPDQLISSKFEMTCNTVKNGTAEPEMEHIKSISKGHQFEDDPVTQFESITKCETTKYEFFHFLNDMRYG